MERNQMIDLFKFIFSIFVICVHAQLFKDTIPIAYYTLTMGICRIAVPFFFVVSGYYFYQRLQQKRSVKEYFVKLLKIFFCFEFIEIIIFTPFLFPYYHFFEYLWKILSTGLSGTYWYLISLIISLLIMTPLWKKKNIIPFFIVGFFLYLLCMTNDSYSQLFVGTQIQKISILHTKIWTWSQAGLCSSLFYLSLGAMIYQYQPQIKHTKIILLIALIYLLGESYILQSHQATDGNSYFSLIVLAPMLVVYCLKYPKCHFSTRRLGQMSLYIYMIHPIVLNCLNFILPLPKMIILVIVIVICMVVSYLLTGGKKNGIIRYC